MRNPLSEDAWAKIVRLYTSGEVGMNALAIRFGLTYEAIRLGLTKRGIGKEQRKIIKRKSDVGKAA